MHRGSRTPSTPREVEIHATGRRAAEDGAPIIQVEAEENRLFTDRDRRLWRQGWREGKKAAIGLAVRY